MMTMKQVESLKNDAIQFANVRRNDEDAILELAKRIVKLKASCVRFGLSKEDVDTVEDVVFYLTENTANFCYWVSELCGEYAQILTYARKG